MTIINALRTHNPGVIVTVVVVVIVTLDVDVVVVFVVDVVVVADIVGYFESGSSLS